MYGHIVSHPEHRVALVVTLLLACSAKSVGKTYDVLSQVEWWARMVAGGLFILVGIRFSLTDVLELRFDS